MRCHTGGTNSAYMHTLPIGLATNTLCPFACSSKYYYILVLALVNMDIYCNYMYDYILVFLLVFMTIYWRYDAGSWFLSLMGMLQIVLAITVSMFVYRHVCQVDLVCDLEQLFSASQNIFAPSVIVVN